MVVYCTGYKITFPFFDEDFISAPENHIELFRRVFHPEIPNVFFIGLLQPLGAIMPLAEAQGAWVGDYLLGDYALPPAARDARGHRGRPGGDACALRGLQAPHDPGRLRRLSARAGQRAARGRRTGARKRVYPTGVMPTFCRHNRFIERCPICSKTLPGRAPGASASPRAKTSARARSGSERRAAPACARRGRAHPARGARRRRRLPLGAGARVCGPPPTRCGWPRRSRSPAGACSRWPPSRRGSTARRARWRREISSARRGCAS